MAKHTKKHRLSIRWLTDSRYRGSQTPISDWLKSGPPPKPKISEWLEEPLDRTPEEPAPEAAAPAHSPWPWYRLGPALMVGIAVGLGYALDHPRAGLLAILLWFVVSAMIVYWLITFLVRHWRAALATLGAGATAVGAFASNPQCLEPTIPNDFTEQVICLYVSVGAKPLPLLLPLQLASRGPSSSGDWSLDGLGSRAYAAPSDSPESPVRDELTSAQAIQFQSCTLSLYEDPALREQAHAMRKWRIDEATAYDAVMDTLLRVCLRHIDNPVKELKPYFVRSVRNWLTDNFRRETRELSKEVVPEAQEFTPPLALLNHEREWYSKALASLNESEQRVLERWKRGGTWQEVGRDLGMTPSAAANLYHNALYKLHRRVKALQDQAEHPGRRRRGRRALPAE